MIRFLAPLALATLAAACATIPKPDPQAQFWQALSGHCGKAFAGRMVSDEAPDEAMRGQPMVVHVRSCSATRIEAPFHIRRQDGSWDRSRTWVLTRTPTGLHLAHDHRHEDGSPDVLTMYGGETAGEGTARMQDFPVDAFSKALFARENRSVSLTNVWTVAVDPPGTPNAAFTYRLRRAAPAARDFHVVFDLTAPVAPPPAPWGHD